MNIQKYGKKIKIPEIMHYIILTYKCIIYFIKTHSIRTYDSFYEWSKNKWLVKYFIKGIGKSAHIYTSYIHTQSTRSANKWPTTTVIRWHFYSNKTIFRCYSKTIPIQVSTIIIRVCACVCFTHTNEICTTMLI